MSTSKIKWCLNTNTNAPQISNEWGVFPRILKKLLVEGFFLGASKVIRVDSKYIYFEKTFNISQYQLIEIKSESGLLNGEHRVVEITSDFFTIPLVDNATSFSNENFEFSFKGLGWEIVHESLNSIVFKPNGDQGPNHCLHVNNNAPYPDYPSTKYKFVSFALSENSKEGTPLGLTAPTYWNSTASTLTGTDFSPASNFALYSLDTYLTSSSSLSAYTSSTTNGSSWFFTGNSDYFYFFYSTHASYTYSSVIASGNYTSFLEGYEYNSFLIPSNLKKKDTEITVVPTYINTAVTTSGSCSTVSGYLDTTHDTMSLASLNGITRSGYDDILNPAGPCFFFDVFLKDPKQTLLGSLPSFYWLAQNRPFTRGGIFKRGSELFMARELYIDRSNLGQVVVKIGELNE